MKIEHVFLSLKVVFPLLLFLFLGYRLKRTCNLKENTLQEINRLVFHAFLPAMLFSNIYSSNLEEEFQGLLLGYSIFAVLICFGLTFIFIPRIEADHKKQSVMIQGIYRSNFVLFGLQVTESIYGRNRMGMTSILVAVIIPLFNVLAIFLFESYKGKKNNGGILKGIVSNPLILASVFGILFHILNVKIPSLILEPVKTMGVMATPMALLILGGTFVFDQIGNYKKQLLICMLGRLIVIPAIFVSIGIALGYRNTSLVALLVLFASPTAVTSYSMAMQMGGDAELAGQIVVFTTIGAIGTMFLWILGLSSLGFLGG